MAGASTSGPCCEPSTYPNVGDASAAGAGRVGALLIGARVPRGVVDAAPASHFTLLRVISDLFALQPLGYAGVRRSFRCRRAYSIRDRRTTGQDGSSAALP
jgi:hypothetical protein